MSARPRPVPAPAPGATSPPGTSDTRSVDAAADGSHGAAPAGMVEIHNVSKFFGDVVAVSDVTFSVRAGVTALLGPNGAGKSTLFRMMCGLTPPSRGTVRVLGADARADRDVRGRIGLSPSRTRCSTGSTRSAS